MPTIISKRILRPSSLDNENGLQVWWPFYDGSAVDTSGHGLVGTLKTTGSVLPIPAPDMLVTPLAFDGSTNYVEASDASLPSGAAPRTMMAWFKISSGGANYRTIVSYGTRGEAQWFALIVNPSGHFDCSLYGSDLQTGTIDDDGNWHHGAVTFDGTTRTLYLDGLSKGTDTSGVNTVLNTFLVGRNADPGEYFPGSIGDVRVYNSCLSPAEVFSIYARAWACPVLRERDVPSLNEPGILFDAASNSTYKTAASTYSWSHTCTGSNRYLTIGVSMLSVGGSSVSSITYNGVNLSLIKAQASVSGAVRSEIWGLAAPATGSNTIAVTLSAALDSIGGAVSFTGVNQTSSTEASNSATATNVGAADATVDVTTVADKDWCVDVVATDDTAITVGAGQTSRNNVTGTLGSGAMSTEGPKTPAGSVTMGWTNVAALATWSIVSVALRPITASSAVTLTAINGTFIETGINALFRINEVFNKGTFILSGQAAQQARPVGKGTFTETGINALFRINFVDSSGTFTEAGKTVLFNFNLPSNKGTFSEFGQTALFKINEVFSKGTFILTGIAAALKIGTFLTAATGTFTMSGKNILFQIDSVDGKGTFTLSGKNSNLTPSMVSSKGTFSEVGKAVLFDIDMNMNKGTFTLTGRDATLIDTGAAPALNDDWIIRFRRRRER